ncbi:permease [uncultured Flavonifractor sp.]|uniref:permease n=1 Tax=uncultured Flavonifractor sp. TaxID=1193534 RepID=UPI0026129CD7|nr:permease [uncultured Flavonifractor sp.]
MEQVAAGWQFVQDQILGIKWLEALIGKGLEALGVDLTTRWGGSLHFFCYDVLKITILLCTLIFLVSYLQSYFPPERSRRILGRFHGIWANLLSALLGTVTPFCSCSSIPLFMGFTSAGLPIGVTFSFLISSPMVDLGSLVLLMSIFGAKVAVLYVVVGLLIAVAGGTLLEKLRMDRYVEDFVRQATVLEEEGHSPTQRERLGYAKGQMIATFRKVFPYVLLGVGVGAVIHNWLPKHWIEVVLGDGNPLGVVLATLVGVPMYADIFGTIPIAEALLSKGAQLGTVLSFMMAVTTLSLPSLILLRKVVKPRLLAAFLIVCTVGIIVVGYLFNLFQSVIL